MKHVFFFLVFTLVISNCCCSQSNKYGLVFHDTTGKIETHYEKKMLMNYLEELNSDSMRLLNNNPFISIHNPDGVLLPDTIKDYFLVVDVRKKNNNFVIRNGRIRRQTIYLIDVISQHNPQRDYYRIISIGKRKIYSKRIRKGAVYFFTIIPLSKKHCCLKYYGSDGKIINVVRRPDEALTSIFYESIWIPYIDLSSYNYGTSPDMYYPLLFSDNKLNQKRTLR